MSYYVFNTEYGKILMSRHGIEQIIDQPKLHSQAQGYMSVKLVSHEQERGAGEDGDIDPRATKSNGGPGGGIENSQ